MKNQNLTKRISRLVLCIAVTMSFYGCGSAAPEVEKLIAQKNLVNESIEITLENERFSGPPLVFESTNPLPPGKSFSLGTGIQMINSNAGLEMKIRIKSSRLFGQDSLNRARIYLPDANIYGVGNVKRDFMSAKVEQVNENVILTFDEATFTDFYFFSSKHVAAKSKMILELISTSGRSTEITSDIDFLGDFTSYAGNFHESVKKKKSIYDLGKNDDVIHYIEAVKTGMDGDYFYFPKVLSGGDGNEESEFETKIFRSKRVVEELDRWKVYMSPKENALIGIIPKLKNQKTAISANIPLEGVFHGRDIDDLRLSRFFIGGDYLRDADNGYGSGKR